MLVLSPSPGAAWLLLALLFGTLMCGVRTTDQEGQPPAQSQEQQDWWLACANETGLHSERHNRTLRVLNGSHIAFVGDSISRYQYLELAYYVVHGTCPDEKSRRFLLMETKFKRYSTETTPHWDVFHRMTSTQLNAQSHSWQSWETCFCNSEEDRIEYRNFVYNMREEQISFHISYLAYFNESHKTLAAVVRLASVFQPFESLPYSRHAHKTAFIWQTTTPHHIDGKAIFPQAALVPEVCKLNISLVVDRAAAVDKLVRQGWRFEELYWPAPGNKNHFLAEANHAFNAEILTFMALRAEKQ